VVKLLFTARLLLSAWAIIVEAILSLRCDWWRSFANGFAGEQFRCSQL